MDLISISGKYKSYTMRPPHTHTHTNATRNFPGKIIFPLGKKLLDIKRLAPLPMVYFALRYQGSQKMAPE